jgi:hypothetical protein
MHDMHDLIRRLFHAVSASTAFFFAAMSMWLVLTTRGISTIDGLSLLAIAAAGLFGLVVHGLLALEKHSETLSILPDASTRSFRGLAPRGADRPLSHGA